MHDFDRVQDSLSFAKQIFKPLTGKRQGDFNPARKITINVEIPELLRILSNAVFPARQ